jgi:hypothetical protein
MSAVQAVDSAGSRRDPAPRGLADFGCNWDQTRRNEGIRSRSLELDDIEMTSQFEGGNGMDMSRIGPDHYFVRCEPDPGEHRFSGKSYYFCFAMRNPLTVQRRVTVRIAAAGWNYFGLQSRHYIVRRGDSFEVVGEGCCRRVWADNETDLLDIDVLLPPGDEKDPVVISNFHWNRYSELRDWLGTVPAGGAKIKEIGASAGGLPITAIEIGNDSGPAILIAQTSQPSELSSTPIIKAMVEHLLQDTPRLRDLRARARFCFLPMSNPDGQVRGLTVSTPGGRFPVFEGDKAATSDPGTVHEAKLLWGYLSDVRPAIYWEWHSNNWSRRPGHMVLRYRDELIADAARRQHWVELEDALLRLPDTHHENFTSHTEGPYQPTMGFQAATRLGCISTMIKNHEKYPLSQSISFGISCLELAAAQLLKM